MNERTDHPIVVYSSPSCTECMMLKEWLASNGHVYTEKSITIAKNRQELISLGILKLPVFVQGSLTVVGFNLEVLKNHLEGK